MATLMLPLEVHEHAVKCGACGGSGVTGDRYDMEAGEHTLSLEIFCLECGGCGSGDPDHIDCAPDWHPYPGDVEGPPMLEDLEDGDDDRVCLSCGSGRGWYPVQGFTEGDDPELYLLRVLCGCATERLVPAG
jgi:hypothetical protein